MARQDLNTLQQQLDQIEAQILGWEAKLVKVADRDSDEGVRLRGIIGNLKDEYDQLSAKIEQAQQLEHNKTKKNNWKSEQPLVDQAIDENHMGYIASMDQFIYCRNHGAEQSNVQFRTFPATRIVRIMNKLTGISIASKDVRELTDYFENRQRNYLDVTASFNKSKWNEREIYNKMSVIRKYWLQPDFVNADSYNPSIDVLIESVCGGKQENIEHLEKWVAFKYLFPEKNANTPNIDLGGNPGGNGKGRFVEMLKTIFTPTCVVQAHREELEKFNANWEMAVILYYDEPSEKELAANKLKQATGSEDMRIEKKGIDATMADRNYNFVFMSNNEKGVVKLSGGPDGGEDRRYSVINTDIVLRNLLDDAGFSDQDGLTWLNNLNHNVVKNRDEIAKWLAHAILKHNVAACDTLEALHGQDYKNRFETQKDVVTQAFDLIYPEFERQGCLPLMTLVDFVKIYAEDNKEVNTSDKSISAAWETYLRRNRFDYEAQTRQLFDLMWNDNTLRSKQGKIYVTDVGNQHVFDIGTLYTKRPNYDTPALSILHKADIKLM